MHDDAFYEVTCSNCGHSEVCGPQQMLSRLRDGGMFKREKDPDPVLVQELFVARATEMSCSACQRRTVAVALLAGWEDHDWGESRRCQRCAAPIAKERLEVFPNAQFCIDCQQSDDQGVDDGTPDYCSRCGGILELRISRRTGTSQYVMRCRDCGYGR